MRSRRVPPDRSIRYPAEIILATYLLIAAVSSILLRPPHWPWLLAVNGIACGAFAAASRMSPASSRWLRGLRSLLPILLFPLLYHGTGRLNIGLPVWVLDLPLESLEVSLFHGHPSLYLSRLAPWLLLSEFLHLSYVSFYLLVPCLPLALFLERRERLQSYVVFMICTCFSVCLVSFIWFPVTSPLYKFPHIGPPLSKGFFMRFAHAISGRGGVVGGAFPSSHAALTVLNLLLAARWERRVFWVTLVPSLGLLVATVYGRYHYALDTIAGTLLGVLVCALLGRRPWPGADGLHQS